MTHIQSVYKLSIRKGIFNFLTYSETVKDATCICMQSFQDDWGAVTRAEQITNTVGSTYDAQVKWVCIFARIVCINLISKKKKIRLKANCDEGPE